MQVNIGCHILSNKDNVCEKSILKSKVEKERGLTFKTEAAELRIFGLNAGLSRGAIIETCEPEANTLNICCKRQLGCHLKQHLHLFDTIDSPPFFS